MTVIKFIDEVPQCHPMALSVFYINNNNKVGNNDSDKNGCIRAETRVLFSGHYHQAGYACFVGFFSSMVKVMITTKTAMSIQQTSNKSQTENAVVSRPHGLTFTWWGCYGL